MKLHKSFKHALGMVLHSRLRSWLTIVGIVIGVASVIAIIALGDGLQAAVASQFSGRGVDLLTISAGAARGGGFGGGGGGFGGGGGGAAANSNNKTPELTRADIQTLKGVNLVGDIDTQISGQVAIYYLGQNGKVGVTGVDQDVWAKMTNPTLQAGRPLGPSDTNVVVIGGRLASTYFKSPVGINKGIVLGGRAFRVVGVLNDSSTSVYMPIDSAYPLLLDHDPDVYDRIVVQVRDVTMVSNASAAITQALSLRRHVITRPDFSVSDPSAFLQTRQQTVSSLTTFLTMIAAVALLVGAVGIANTMFTSVLERTKQIGIMKAIGATRSDILTIFLLNAALIGLIGGIIGAVFGVILAQLMPQLLSLGPVGGSNAVAIVKITTILFAIGISVLIGVVAGIIPAWNASKLRPVDALRYE